MLFTTFEPYLAKVTLSEHSQEIKVIQANLTTNLQRRNALLWWHWRLLLWLLKMF
jgi:hypothetical protein